jgi:hypothetical protein
MNSKELTEAINKLAYPGLSRTLGELKLVSSASVDGSAAKVELLTVSDDSYLSVKKVIEEAFSEQFERLEITKKIQAKKDMN